MSAELIFAFGFLLFVCQWVVKSSGNEARDQRDHDFRLERDRHARKVDEMREFGARPITPTKTEKNSKTK